MLVSTLHIVIGVWLLLFIKCRHCIVGFMDDAIWFIVRYLVILIGANASFEYMILVYSCLFKVLVGYLGEQPRLFCGTDLMLPGWSKPASASAFVRRTQNACFTAMVARDSSTLRVENSVLGDHGR